MDQKKFLERYSLLMTGPLYQDGWVRSVEEQQVVDLYGKPIPWITYPCLDFLKSQINSSMIIFKYGSGNSTLWWAERVKKVISCEHDEIWYRKMISQIPSNVELFNVDLEYGGAYSKKILEYNFYFDIVIIDGRDRVNCAINSINALKPNGVIIWDNSDREQYKRGFDYLISKGFKRIDFIGLAPMANIKTSTAIFYRLQNCLDM